MKSNSESSGALDCAAPENLALVFSCRSGAISPSGDSDSDRLRSFGNSDSLIGWADTVLSGALVKISDIKLIYLR